MKKIVVVVFFAAFLCISCVSEGNKTQNNKFKDYTFLIYMNGSDLESEHNAGTTDLYEMMKVGSTETTNVIIETGGTKKWQNYYIDPTQNQRWMVKKNNLLKLLDLGTKNMGQSETLKDFLVWGIEKYPARKYALILWNHGGGAISGFGYDEKHNYDTLLLVELQKALKEAYNTTDTKLEVIGFDACLMASLETASIVAPYANYLVGSTELEPSIGWEYSSFLKKASQVDLSGKRLGEEIANGFFADTKKRGLSDTATLSVIHTQKVAALTTSFEDFIGRASDDIYDIQGFNQISSSVSKSEYYGGQSENEGYSNMIDLGDFAGNLGDNYGEDRKKIIENVNDAVVYQVKGKTKEQSSGISIYFPYYNKESIAFELPIYGTIGFSKSYNDFLNKYTDVASKDTSGVELSSENIKKEEGVYKLKIGTKDSKNISRTSTVLGRQMSQNKIILYGGRPTASYNEEQGEVKTHFDNKWITLNGQLVYTCITRESEEYTTYSIPVILNDEYANIKVAWYPSKVGTGHYEIIGAWHGIIPDNMIVRKEIIKIQKGDVIQPILKEYDIKEKEKKSIKARAFVLKENPKIIEEKVEGKEYVLGFCIDDYCLNQCFSKFIRIDR